MAGTDSCMWVRGGAGVASRGRSINLQEAVAGSDRCARPELARADILSTSTCGQCHDIPSWLVTLSSDATCRMERSLTASPGVQVLVCRRRCRSHWWRVVAGEQRRSPPIITMFHDIPSRFVHFLRASQSAALHEARAPASRARTCLSE